jgi:uncharacterized protein YjbI with pentapeptide repeats
MNRTQSLREPTRLRSSTRRRVRGKCLWLFATALGFAVVSHASAASLPAAQTCTAAKLVAATKALVCRARQENKRIRGGSADLAGCATKLDSDFAEAEAEASGACPTTGDVATVGALVVDTEAGVLTSILASSAVTSRQKFCTTQKNLAAAKYVQCIGTAGARRLSTKPDRVGRATSEYARCQTLMFETFTRREKSGVCLTTDDAYPLSYFVNPVGTYLPGAIFPDGTHAPKFPTLFEAILVGADLRGATMSTNAFNADFTDADLTGATLTQARLDSAFLVGTNLSNANVNFANARNAKFNGANLTGANLNATDVTGADLTGVIWSSTKCGDGSSSATNGSSPESCCGHFPLGAPAACSP